MNQTKTAFEAGIMAEMSSPGMKLTGDGVKGFARLTQSYSHDMNSATTKDQMLNRTAMFFQGATHLLANDKNLTPQQKTKALNSMIKGFETKTMENLSPVKKVTSSSLTPTERKKENHADITALEKASRKGNPLSLSQMSNVIQNANTKFKAKSTLAEQDVLNKNIKTSVDKRFVPEDK